MLFLLLYRQALPSRVLVVVGVSYNLPIAYHTLSLLHTYTHKYTLIHIAAKLRHSICVIAPTAALPLVPPRPLFSPFQRAFITPSTALSRVRERFLESFSRGFHAQQKPGTTPETDVLCDSQRWQPVLPVQDRVRYEADALREQHRLCPEHVPAVYHFDAKNALIVMQYLPPPHVILRKSITQA